MGEFTQGMAAGAGMVRTANNIYNNTRAEDRNQLQQKMTMAMNHFDENGNPDDVRKTKTEIELDQAKSALMAMKAENDVLASMKSKDTITGVFTNWYRGNFDDALKELQNNPLLVDKLRKSPNLDIVNIDVPNWDSPEDQQQLKELGVDTSKLKDPEVRDTLNRSFMRIQGHDGSWRLASVDQAMKETNTINYMAAKDRDEYALASQHKNGIIKGLLPHSQDAASKATELAGSTAEAKLVDMETYFKDNPNATYTDYQAWQQKKLQQDKPMSISEQKAKFELENAMNEKAIKDYVNTNPKQWLSTLSNSTIDTKIGDKPIYAIAKKVQGDNKLANSRRDYLDGMVSTVKNARRLESKLKTADFDWDAVSKAMDEVSKITGPEWRGLSPKEQTNLLNKFSFDSDLRTVMAGYIKAMSGAAVSDEERKFYENAILGGNWSTRGTALASMKGFISGVQNGLKTSIDSIKSNLPATYLEYKNNIYDKDYYLSISPDEIKKMSDNDKIAWLKAKGIPEDQIRKAQGAK